MAKMQQASTKSSKKGLIIGIVVLAVVIAVAAIAYNVLAPGARSDANLQATGAAATSGAGETESANNNAPDSASEGTTGSTAASDNESASSTTNGNQGSSGSGSQGSSGSQNTEAVAAPDFPIEDAAGNVIQFRSLLGKPTVLNFWASTCGPCQREMPDFQRAFESEGESVQFVMVNISDFNGESVARAKSFIQQNGYTFPVYFSTDDQASIEYGLSSIPRTFFIDASGNVIATAAGMLDAETLQRGLSMIR